MTQREKNDEVLFALHNTQIMPAMAQINKELALISEQNKRTTELQNTVADKLNAVEREQIGCIATRREQAKNENKALNRAAKIGGWSGLGVLVLGFISGAWYAAKIVVKQLAAGNLP